MELRVLLRDGFDYDLWANRQWVRALGGFNTYLPHAQAVLEHILSAQQIWLERCGAMVETRQENVRLEDLFEQRAREWQAFIEFGDLQDEIHYNTSRGEPHVNSLAQIVYHVLNHGTYHRGQLRGLAQADNHQTFPETDLIFYLRKRDG